MRSAEFLRDLVVKGHVGLRHLSGKEMMADIVARGSGAIEGEGKIALLGMCFVPLFIVLCLTTPPAASLRIAQILSFCG